ncbi:MAG: hypothetical protein AAGA48_28915 [Myxococcota bacterium]
MTSLRWMLVSLMTLPAAACFEIVLPDSDDDPEPMPTNPTTPPDPTEPKAPTDPMMDPPALIEFVTVTLNTLKDDKRDDSMIRLEVLDQSGRVIASDEDTYGRFADSSTRQIPLDILDPSVTFDEVDGGDGCIEWRAIGSLDQWNVAFDYEVGFSDNTVLIGVAGKTEFSQSRTTLQCAALR